MKYKVIAYIKVESEDEETYDSSEQAEEVIKSLELMHPENIYKIEEVEHGGYKMVDGRIPLANINTEVLV